MTHDTINHKPVHRAAEMHAREYREGKLSRREFLTRATMLGVTATAAYGMIGLPAPARAQEMPKQGGTLRIQQSVKAMKGIPSATAITLGVANGLKPLKPCRVAGAYERT